MNKDSNQEPETLPLTYRTARVLTAEDIARVSGGAGGEDGTSGPTGQGGGDPGPIIIHEADYRRDF